MKYILPLANLIFLTLAVAFGVQLMYQGLETGYFQVSEPDIRALERHGQDGKVMAPPKPRSYYSTIETRNLFSVIIEENQASANPEKKPVDDLANLDKTDLDVKLWGTVTGSGKHAYAVIEDRKSRKQGLYREGDTVLEAIIRKILREKVVLTHNGKDQILEMAEETRRTVASAPPPALMPSPSGNQVVLDRSVITEQTRDINSLMRQVRVRPHFSKGKPDGLLLYGIKNDSLFQKMGLKNGDIIMGVDGNVIKSVDDALSLYNNLTSATNVNMQIKRRGKIEEINYHVQ